MTDKITVGLDIDGYDVEVEICESCIEKTIKKLEKRYAHRINTDGVNFLNPELAKFAVVNAEPTDEKWRELAGME